MEKGYARDQVCLDAKEVVQAVKGDVDWAINPIVANVKKLILNFAHMEFSYIHRNLNFAVHSFTKLFYSCKNDMDWERAVLFLEVGR